MRLRAVLLIILSFIFFKTGHAQLQASNWRFGTTPLGLQFSTTGTITVTTNSYTPHGNEGCSVLSDQITGALKFYTDGMVVVDANDQLMPNGNGLIGHSSSLGSGKIAADPVNCNRYYIFHNNSAYEVGGSNGLYYSVVDMTLPGNGTAANPKGDVVAGQKNILIAANVGEGIEVIPVANSHNFWLLIPINSSNSIFVYKFTSTGSTLASTYPLQSVLVDMRPIVFCTVNSKLALSSLDDNDNLLVFDFDIATGTISNEKVIPGIPKTYGQYYGTGGLCWSPSGKILYISKYRNGGDGGKLYQYDLTTNSTQLIYDVGPGDITVTGRGLKMGPDGKMYYLHGPGSTQYIGAINNPDVLGAGCNFKPRQIDMGSSLNGAGRFPDFLYLNDSIRVIRDTVFHQKMSCSSGVTLDTTFNLGLTNVDIDGDHLSYTLLKTSSSTAQAILTSTGIHYKNAAIPPYTDTITVKYCDDYCINKCRKFKCIIQVTKGSLTSLNLPPVMISCGSAAITLTVSTGLLNYKWSTGATTSSILVNSSGVYKVTAEDPNGCHYSDSTTVSFRPKPIVKLGSDTASCDSIVLKVNQSFPKILWNNGSTKPMITVKTSGMYNVQVTDQYGCSNADTITVLIHPPPVIDIGGPYYFCGNAAINQTLTVTGMKDVLWSTGSTANTIVVTTAGTYTVKVTDQDGCKANDQATISTSPAPVAAFNATNACKGVVIDFTDNSTVISGTIQKWKWDFGDGTFNANQSPSHAYQNSGSYPVKLIVTSANGCLDSIVKTITVYEVPIINFTITNLCQSRTIECKDQSATTPALVSWNWNFGDGNNSGLQHPTHTYAVPGNYTITLTGKTQSGCGNTVIKQVVVNKPMKADFIAKNACDGKTTELKNNSATDPAVPVTFSWNFDDGTTDQVSTDPLHLFPRPGNYNIKLIVHTTAGCVDSVTKKITINPNPIADFTTNHLTGCSPLTIDFKDMSTLISGKITKWAWELGNKNSTTKNPENVYTNTGKQPNNYTVQLLVTSDSGCTAMTTKKNFITVYPLPDAAFSLTPKITSLSNPLITFKNNSTGSDSALWDFGDQATSGIFHTLPHAFKDTGTYVIKLIVYSAFGCIDSTYQEVIIQPEFSFYIPNSFTPNGDGLNDAFAGKGAYIKEYEMTVFNRWGNIMFQTDDVNGSWDGSKNNKNDLAGEDVYVYTVSITDCNKKKHFYRGVVTLVR
jgi:gliding motility-associated-like protein